jgi:putative phosphoesterase
MMDFSLLVCSDLHGSTKAIEVLRNAVEDDPFDAVVICGDFTTNGSLKYVNEVLHSVQVPILGVPGNCDTKAIADLLDRAGASVHGRRVEVKGLRFFGFGGAPPSQYGMPFEVDEETMAQKIREVGVPRGIMVTHTPALGMNDLSKTGHKMGSEALLEVAREFRPRLALSGHVHEARGEAVSHGTLFVNPGPAKDGCFAKVRIRQSTTVSLCRI